MAAEQYRSHQRASRLVGRARRKGTRPQKFLDLLEELELLVIPMLYPYSDEEKSE